MSSMCNSEVTSIRSSNTYDSCKYIDIAKHVDIHLKHTVYGYFGNLQRHSEIKTPSLVVYLSIAYCMNTEHFASFDPQMQSNEKKTQILNNHIEDGWKLMYGNIEINLSENTNYYWKFFIRNRYTLKIGISSQRKPFKVTIDSEQCQNTYYTKFGYYCRYECSVQSDTLKLKAYGISFENDEYICMFLEKHQNQWKLSYSIDGRKRKLNKTVVFDIDNEDNMNYYMCAGVYKGDQIELVDFKQNGYSLLDCV